MALNKSLFSLSFVQYNISPDDINMSISFTVSCPQPYLKLLDSIDIPVIAPPTVIELSSGTTFGIKPYFSVSFNTL